MLHDIGDDFSQLMARRKPGQCVDCGDLDDSINCDGQCEVCESIWRETQKRLKLTATERRRIMVHVMETAEEP